MENTGIISAIDHQRFVHHRLIGIQYHTRIRTSEWELTFSKTSKEQKPYFLRQQLRCCRSHETVALPQAMTSRRCKQHGGALYLCNDSAFRDQRQPWLYGKRATAKLPRADTSSTSLLSCIESPVLKQVYPHLLQHLEEYGNPNIPLGNSQGRQCETLRRLQTQQKLKPDEVSLLTDIGFRFDSLEDFHEKVDFDKLMSRILTYKNE